MGFLENYCTFCALTEEKLSECQEFDCEHSDLNAFFKEDSINYSKEFLGKTYCFTLDSNPSEIVCAFTVANDSIKVNFLPNGRKKKVTKLIPREKEFRSYPAVLIGRLGVNKAHKKKGIGKELLDFIKAWFIENNNKTGCRYIVVDSYNETTPINFYKSNQFEFLFSTEDQEKEYTGIKNASLLRTRLMFFDLIVLSPL